MKITYTTDSSSEFHMVEAKKDATPMSYMGFKIWSESRERKHQAIADACKGIDECIEMLKDAKKRIQDL